MKRLGLALLLVGAPLVGTLVLTLSNSREKDPLIWASVVTAILIAATLALLESVARGNPNKERGKYGYLEIVLGTDGRVSTSKTAVITWTLVFAASLMFLSVLVWFGNLTADKAFGEDWNAYFLLLGGPFASAVAAKAITSGKVSAGTVTKTPTDAATTTAKTSAATTPEGPKVSDMVSGDDGEISMPDTQYVVFTLVAIAYFVGALVALIVDYGKGTSQEITLPVIPSALLGLTSLAALTYVGTKAVEKEGVRVVTVAPEDPKAGGVLTVTLVNVRAGATTANVSFIWTKDEDTPDVRGAADLHDDGLITTVAGQCPSVGEYSVTIVTPNGSTAPFKVTLTGPEP